VRFSTKNGAATLERQNSSRSSKSAVPGSLRLVSTVLSSRMRSADGHNGFNRNRWRFSLIHPCNRAGPPARIGGKEMGADPLPFHSAFIFFTCDCHYSLGLQ
jgi:hypothetical protein